MCSTGAGTHRVNWDLRADAPPVFTHDFEINANFAATPPSPEGPLVPPGTYTVRLSANGVRAEQKVVVRNDPRSSASAAAVQAQHVLQRALTGALESTFAGQQRADALRAAVDGAASGGAADVVAAATALHTALDAFAGPAQAGVPSLRGVNAAMARQLIAQDNADHAPTAPMRAAFAATCRDLDAVRRQWTQVTGASLAALNAALSSHGLRAVTADVAAIAACQPLPAAAAPAAAPAARAPRQ